MKLISALAALLVLSVFSRVACAEPNIVAFANCGCSCSETSTLDNEVAQAIACAHAALTRRNLRFEPQGRELNACTDCCNWCRLYGYPVTSCRASCACTCSRRELSPGEEHDAMVQEEQEHGMLEVSEEAEQEMPEDSENIRDLESTQSNSLEAGIQALVDAGFTLMDSCIPENITCGAQMYVYGTNAA